MTIAGQRVAHTGRVLRRLGDVPRFRADVHLRVRRALLLEQHVQQDLLDVHDALLDRPNGVLQVFGRTGANHAAMGTSGKNAARSS